MSPFKLESLDAHEREETSAWFRARAEELPASIRKTLENHAALWQALEEDRRRHGQVLSELLRELKITPSTEKLKSKDPLGPTTGNDRSRPKTGRERLQQKIDRIAALADLHRRHARSRQLELRRMKKKGWRSDSDSIFLGIFISGRALQWA